MIKDIFAVVEDAEQGKAFLSSTARFALERSAFLEVAALTPALMVTPAVAPIGALYLPPAVVVGSDADNLAAIRAQLAESGCSFDVIGFHDNIVWLADDLGRSRQIADLILVGTEDGWVDTRLRTRVLQTLIRSAGTPIMILPTGQAVPRIQRAVLGWKPTAEAIRAVHALVQFAEAGAAIDIVTVEPAPGATEKERDSHDEVIRHLTRHGFDARGKRIANHSQSEADTLAGYAQEVGADILAIGGFAHSRVRQIILGSVTRDVAVRAALPVLVSG